MDKKPLLKNVNISGQDNWVVYIFFIEICGKVAVEFKHIDRRRVIF